MGQLKATCLILRGRALRALLSVGVLLLCAILSQAALAEESFPLSYSGRLTEANGAPLDGVVDIEASFWSEATEGTRLGGYAKSGVGLTNGVFTLQIPLSAGEVAVIFKEGADPVYIEISAGGKKYPRQLYMFTPLALRIPIDDKHLVYDTTTGRLRLKMDQAATNGSVLTSDGQGGLAWRKIEATQIVAKDAAGAAPSSNQVLTYDGTQWIAAPVTKASNVLTGVTGVAPITVTGSGTVPSIAIAQSSGTTAGYLSSADWSAFNAKQAALGYAPLNKAGDTLTGALNVNGQDVTNTGNLVMSGSKVFGVSNNPSDPTVNGTADKGKLWFNSTSNELKYFDGAAIKTLGTAGSGLQSFNGLAANSQTLATPGTSGTAPNWSSNDSAHTLHIPMASTPGVTAGLLSGADYNTFKNKVGSVIAGTGVGVSTTGTAATVNLANTAVTPGSYSRANITVDAQGRLTSAQSAAAIVDADISTTANIAQSKISGLSADLGSKEPAITAGTTGQYWRGDKSWQSLTTSVVTEGSNQYFTPARAISALSSAAPITYSTVTGTIGISQASGSVNGYLSSSDWTTFNAKQNALGFTPLNKAGDTLIGALDFANNDLNAAGNVQIAAAKTLGLGVYSSDPSGLTAADKGKTWFNSTANQIKYWDGSSVQTVGAVGAAVSNLNGQSGASQSFGVPGTAGTAPAWSSFSNVHTLNIPMASTSSVTAGLLSNTDYAAFSAKQSAGNYLTTLTGDVTTSGFVSGSATATLPNVVNAGTSTKVTYDAKGRVISGASLSAGDIPSLSASVITSGTLTVANGGTGATSLAANSVVLGNGTGALQTVAPGSNGNVLTSNGTAWTSAALPATNWAAPGAIGGTTPNAGAFTTITASGNVGIATTSPQRALDVNGSIGNSSGDLVLSAASGRRLNISGSSNSAQLTPADGTIGNPVYYEVNNQGLGQGSPNGLRMGISGANFNGVAYLDTFHGGVAGDTSLAIKTEGTERVRIDSTGNVGIGTTSPGEKLEIGSFGSVRLTTNFWGSGALRFSTNLTGANSVDEYFVQRGGSAATKDFLINHVPTAGKFAVMTSNENARLIVDGTSGNVGIGSDSPAAKLDVAGDLKVSGKYFGSKSGVGYVQPANWSYSFGGAGTTAATLWSDNITVPQDSIIQVTLNGHWQVTTSSCYLSIGIDDVSVDYPCTTANSACYGWAHTYSTLWENMSHSGYAKISAGTHKLSVIGFTYGNTCYLNGSRISYMYFPQ